MQQQIATNNLGIQFAKLTNTVHHFIAEYRLHDPSEHVTEFWTVKDILCHITYWHIYYADNLVAASKGKSFVIQKKSFSQLNQDEVEIMRPYSNSALTTYLDHAHETIGQIIRSGKVTHITYLQGIKPCTLTQFLDVVTGHINQHISLLRKLRLRAVKETPADESRKKGYL